MNIRTTTACLTLLLASLAPAAGAWPTPGLPIALPGSDANKGNDKPADASTQADPTVLQESIVKSYLAAAKDINTAQQHLADAFGLKEQRAALEAQATVLGSGATLTKEQIATVTQVTAGANAAIADKIGTAGELSAEGRKDFIAALPPLATGTLRTAKLPADLQTFSAAAQQQIGKTSVLELSKLKAKLGAGLFLVQELPGFIVKSGSTLKMVVTYAQKNQVPVPAEATDFMGTLASNPK